MAFFATLFGLVGRRGANLSLTDKLLVTLAATAGGAIGGAAYFALDPLRARGGAFKTMANILSLLTYAAVAVLAIAAMVFVLEP